MSSLNRRQMISFGSIATASAVLQRAFGGQPPNYRPNFPYTWLGTRSTVITGGKFVDFNHPDLEGIRHDAEGNLVGPAGWFGNLPLNKRVFGERDYEVDDFRKGLDEYIHAIEKYKVSEIIGSMLDRFPRFAEILAKCGFGAKDEITAKLEMICLPLGLALIAEDFAVSATERLRQIEGAKLVQGHLKLSNSGWITHGIIKTSEKEIQEFLGFQAEEQGPGTRIWQMDCMYTGTACDSLGSRSMETGHIVDRRGGSYHHAADWITNSSAPL